MRFLLIRPLNDSNRTASLLRAKDHCVQIDPVLKIEKSADVQIAFEKYQALIFTSPNAVRIHDYPAAAKGKKIFVVGSKTARAAKQAGFCDIIDGGGDVKKLTDTIIAALAPDNGPVLHICGDHVAGALKEDLCRGGLKVATQEIYRAVAAQTLNEQTKLSLENGAIDFIPFYSPRSALIFIELIKKTELQSSLKNITALCLSPAIEATVASLEWKNIITAQKPTQYDLFEQVGIEL